MEHRIPKIIHYCWLSDEPYPKLISDCIESWKIYLSDYEFVLWDKKKFDIFSVNYVKEAYESKKYAFASDYIRLFALYNYGGIYLDSDIQIFQSFDSLLNQRGFTGFETKSCIAAWLLASEKGNPIFKELLKYYDNRKFIFPDGNFDLTPNVRPITETLIDHGLILNNTFQQLDYISIYPRTYFSPTVPYEDEEECFSDDTIAQHKFNAGWVDNKQKDLIFRKKEISKKYGKKIGLIYYGIFTIINYGCYSFFKQWKERIKIKKREE